MVGWNNAGHGMASPSQCLVGIFGTRHIDPSPPSPRASFPLRSCFTHPRFLTHFPYIYMRALFLPSFHAPYRAGAKDPRVLLNEALRLCGDWHHPIPGMIRATALTDVSGYPIFDRDPLPPRAANAAHTNAANVTTATTANGQSMCPLMILAGDASHPMSPLKGQGANQALLDAISIADHVHHQLRSTTVEGSVSHRIGRAFVAAEKEVCARTCGKVLGSRRSCDTLHHPRSTTTAYHVRRKNLAGCRGSTSQQRQPQGRPQGKPQCKPQRHRGDGEGGGEEEGDEMQSSKRRATERTAPCDVMVGGGGEERRGGEEGEEKEADEADEAEGGQEAYGDVERRALRMRELGVGAWSSPATLDEMAFGAWGGGGKGTMVGGGRDGKGERSGNGLPPPE